MGKIVIRELKLDVNVKRSFDTHLIPRLLRCSREVIERGAQQLGWELENA